MNNLFEEVCLTYFYILMLHVTNLKKIVSVGMHFKKSHDPTEAEKKS